MTQFRVVLLCALMAGTALADNVPFSRGAIIIPMESTFQSQAGSVSAYGLIYRILQANQAGHRNANSLVTVYIANDPTKQSVNRCKPTNTAALTGAVPLPADARWNDGCDFSITNVIDQPVVKVDWAAWPAAGATFAAGALSSFQSAEAWPAYTAARRSSSTRPTPRRCGTCSSTATRAPRPSPRSPPARSSPPAPRRRLP